MSSSHLPQLFERSLIAFDLYSRKENPVMEYYGGNCFQLEPVIKMWQENLAWWRKRRWRSWLSSSSRSAINVHVTEHKSLHFPELQFCFSNWNNWIIRSLKHTSSVENEQLLIWPNTLSGKINSFMCSDILLLPYRVNSYVNASHFDFSQNRIPLK